MAPLKALRPDQLCRVCDAGQFDFETTADLEDLDGAIGQERAIDAIRFGIGIRRPGYNLYALGPPGTGKTAVLRQFIDPQAAVEPVPDDICYVNNFAEAHKPNALRLPPGRGMPLRAEMEALVEDFGATIRAAFDSEDYRARKDVIEDEFKQRQEQAFEELQQKAATKDVTLVRTPTGPALAPTQDGEIVKPEAFNAMPTGERERRSTDIEALGDDLQALLRQVPKWQGAHRKQMRELNRDVSKNAVDHLIDDAKENWRDLPAVGAYLDAVRKDVIEHAESFLGGGEGQPQGPISMESLSRRYRVNLLVSRDGGDGAPVVYEDNPTFENLVGRVEQIAQMGALTTDFTMIKPGALHRANGGYLLLDVRRALLQPMAWEELKRTLRAGEIRIASIGQRMGMVSTVVLEPEPVPLDVKVVLIGDRQLYYQLSASDPDFRKLFKVPADFDDRIDLDRDNIGLYARLIATMGRQQDLRPFDRGAVARVVQQGARLAADSEKITTHMESIADLLREADYWAGRADRAVAAAEDVQKAIDGQIHRADRLRERIQEDIHRETILIDTDGEKVGQINGLSVLQLGGFAFGRPTRITSRVRVGRGRVIDIEREVELGGPLHSKGVLILSNFLAARYATDRPLSLSASLVFEQSYGGVDGDSASSAELYAMLSALSDKPIKQGFAVTGSVNQFGEVQAIGGANEKIEGFFDVCRARGLTGEQGVLIPAANVKNLMLRDDVVEAARDGRFHVYPVETIDQGIELLTGVAADTIHGLVEARLREFADAARRFGRGEPGPDDEGKS